MSRYASEHDQVREHSLTRKSFLKAGVAAGAGLAAISSPLGARGVALARHARCVAAQPLDDSQSVTLRFMTRADVNYHSFFQAAAAAFSKLHPNVTIKEEPHNTDWQTKLLVQIAGGQPPDLVFGGDDQLFSYSARGAFTDLAPFFHADGLKRSDYWPAAIDPQWLGNHLFAMPLDYALHVLYYNKALFDAQHQSYPTDNWTWNDFLQVGRNLTIDRSGKRASEAGFQPEHVRQYAEDGALPYWFWNVLRSNGGDWASADLSKSLLDSPVAVQTIQWIADLGTKYFVSSTPRYATSQVFGMEHGNVAMHFDGTWNIGFYAVSPPTNWSQGNIDIVPFPLGSKGRAVSAEASGLSIPTGVKGQNARWAWEFIKYMTSDPGQRIAFTYTVASIPNNPATARALIPSYKLPRNSRIIMELLPQARLPYWCEAISDIELENILTSPWSPAPEMRDIYVGKKTAAQALPITSRRVQALLDKDQVLARKFGVKLHLSPTYS